jgi:hypothetical protein
MMSEEQRQALRDAVRIVQGPEQPAETPEPPDGEENPGSAPGGDGR